MIYVDEQEPVGEVESQFNHRKVNFKRSKDVRNCYQMIDEIGRGKFGRVMKCRHNVSGEIFAAKFVTCTRREDRRNVEREVEIMNVLKSQKLLQLYEAYDNGRSEMCLITEYIAGGELFDRVIEDEFVLSEKACCIFTKQILEGVSYIHRQQIIHLDLKPENILCLTKSGNRIKIIDFGLARRFEPMKKLQILFGTPEFVAPEVVNFEPIGYSTDMWALGVITYVLVSGLSPFMGDTDLETMANVTIAEYDYEDEAFDNVSKEAKDFIDRLLVKEQPKRANAEECLNHPWLKKISEGAAPVKERESLNVAKDNLNQQKSAWNKRDSNYYLFDSKSRTASQLYETDLPLSITAKMVEQMEVAQSEKEEEDQFSFFTSDGTVRRDSQLVVLPDGKISNKSTTSVTTPTSTNVGERKRSLEDIRPKDDTIEYVGLVKRPKTPLITAGDIRKQAQSLSERKASACGSLPDIVSSSVDTTELHASRCSLLEGDELPEDGNTAELPLPDIVASEEEVREVPPPPILIEEAEEEEEEDGKVQVCPPSEPLVASPQPLVASPCPPSGLTKDYTVEEGFERPEGGWEAAESVTAASVEANCDSEEEEEEETAGKSSSSSSLPSESSGIFYKAEYTPHPSHLASPAPNGLLSVENRDSFWSSFFQRTQSSEASGSLRKSSSGSMDKVRGLPPRPSQVTKSKSDAKVNYSAADLPPMEEVVVGESVSNQREEERGVEKEIETVAFPEIEAIREEIVVARSSVKTAKAEEVDVRPWTECSSGYSPETSNSRDNLSSTISQEMQDLLSSIQSLGKTDSGESGSNLPNVGRRTSQEESNKAGLHRLMAEVENQIRFSATEELLQRMAACPSVEQQPGPTNLHLLTSCSHKKSSSPPVPDLLRPAIESPSENLPSFTSNLESPGNRRITALQRPSDMRNNGRPFTPTGRVPDMLSRVSCTTGYDSNTNPNNFSNLEAVRDDLSKVRNDIDSLRESLNETKTNVVENSKDILARCSFYTEGKRVESSPETLSVSGKSRVSEGSVGTREGGVGSLGSPVGRVSGSSMESDLAETTNAMREIERTVNSFSRPSPSKTEQGVHSATSSPNPRRIFARANQGSVNKTKDRFEQRQAESRLPVTLNGPKPRCTTPFSKTRSPSPSPDLRDKKRQLSIPGTSLSSEPGETSSTGFRGRTGTGNRMSLRKRSPSPVVTGKVSSFRTRFESNPSGGSHVSGNNNSTSTVPRSFRTCVSPHRDHHVPVPPVSSEPPMGRLPTHFVPLTNPTNRPTIGRAQSMRSPRLSLQSNSMTSPTKEVTTSVQAANFLRSTLPRKSLPETPSFERSTQRGFFGYNRI